MVSLPMSAIVENERFNSCTTAREDSCKLKREETVDHLRSSEADTPSKTDEKHFTHVEELYDQKKPTIPLELSCLPET